MDATGTAGELPEGTVTFLFTDVGGSTRLLQAHSQSRRDRRQRAATRPAATSAAPLPGDYVSGFLVLVLPGARRRTLLEERRGLRDVVAPVAAPLDG